MSLRCDRCGKFTRYLNAIWCIPPTYGIACEVCDKCYWKDPQC